MGIFDNPYVRGGLAIATGGGSEIARGVINAGQGDKNAANQLRGIAGDAQQTGAQEQNWFMGGNDTAQGYLAPAAGYARFMGNQGPGQAESAFSNYGQNYFDPTANQNYWSQNQGQYSTPGMAEGVYGSLINNLGTPGAYQQNYGGVVGQLGQSGAAEQYYQGIQPWATGRTDSTGAYGQIQQQLSQPSALGQNYQGLLQNYGMQGQLEGQTNRLSGDYQRPTLLGSSDLAKQYGQQGQLEQQGAGLASGLRGGQLQDLYGQQRGGYQQQSLTEGVAPGLMGQYGRQSSSEGLYGQQMGQELGGPGQLEQFARQSLTADDPYYKQLNTNANADIDAQMAAGGGYNSGARLAALAKSESNFNAQRYHDQAQLQGQAQAATMSRLGQQQNFAGQADQNLYQRLQGLQGAAQASDQTRYQRMAGEQGLAAGASGEQLGRANAQANILNMSDIERQNRLDSTQKLLTAQDQQFFDRTNAQRDLYGMGDTERLNRLNGAADLSKSMSADDVSRANALSAAANNSDQATYNRMNLGATTAQNAQQDRFNQLKQQLDAYQQAQTFGNDATKMQGDFAGAQQKALFDRLAAGSDAANRSSTDQRQMMNDYFTQAIAAQTAQEARQRDAYNAIYGAGAGQAATLGGFMGQAGDVFANLYGAGLGAQVNAAGFDRQASSAPWDRMLALGGLGVSGVGAVSGKR